MRKKIIAGNWKMNMDLAGAEALVKGVIEKVRVGLPDHIEVLFGVPFPYLHLVSKLIKEANLPNVKLAAQNCHFEDNGAYTGEVSADMLKDLGVEYVILGHSERREYFKETDSIILKKMKKALSKGLKVILCVGEKLDQRDNDGHFLFVKNQLQHSLFMLTNSAVKDVVVAYEPIWAIGTGKTATPFEANEMQYYIRDIIGGHFDQKAANDMSILYGGSMKPANAKELVSQINVDGGLIGGASLKAADFSELVQILHNNEIA